MGTMFLYGEAVLLLMLFPSGLGFAYLALRVRDQRFRTPDPQLGLKTAFHVLLTMSVVLLLTGLSLSVGDVFQGVFTGNDRNMAPGRRGVNNPAPANEWWNGTQRTAAAFALCGLLFTLVFRLLLTGTNDHRFPSARRVFHGGRLGLSLVTVFITVTAIATITIQENPDLEPVEMLLGFTLVWAPSAVVHLLLYRRAARLPLEPVKVIVVDSSPDDRGA